MKLCMIGKRGHAFYVFQSIREIPGIELPCVSSGCCDDPEPLLKMARDNGFQPEFRADWKAMLDEFQPDVLCIDGPFELHAEMCAEALKRKIHVFCEKPIALTLEQLEIIRAAYKKAPRASSQWSGSVTNRRSTRRTEWSATAQSEK